MTLPELARRGAARRATGRSPRSRTVAARFAKGVAAIRALLDPEVIVIGGDIAVLAPCCSTHSSTRSRSEQLNQPRLELSTLGADAIVYGAIRHSLSWVERAARSTSAAIRSAPSPYSKETTMRTRSVAAARRGD